MQHYLGMQGMPRRVADYVPEDDWTDLNRLSTVGAFLIAASMLPFLWNVWRSRRHGRPAGPNPWEGHTLEWATLSPPPESNFVEIPPVRSERPLWDVNDGYREGDTWSPRIERLAEAPSVGIEPAGPTEPAGPAGPAEPLDTEVPTTKVDAAVAREEARALPVDARIFLFTTAFFFVVAGIYGIVADEQAGLVLLTLAGVFSAVIFVYVLARDHHHTVDTSTELDRAHRPYFPKASLWPLGVGGGLVMTLSGLALGLWVFLPGLALLARSLVGWARQSKTGT